MTMTDRMDEILGSSVYNLYCPICGTSDSMMFPDQFSEEYVVAAICRECGTQTPMHKREESWN